MTNNGNGRRKYRSLALFAALLGAAAVVGPWLWLAPGVSVPALLGSAVIALTAVFAIVWLFRLRAARRLIAALDAYAEREIARARHGVAWSEVQTFSTPGSVLQRRRVANLYSSTLK